ncbi:MAG: zinc-finger domain-containing protein [Gammaproteobacteria bacterium TMED134]|nr:MAG: zinc-finger domain-containing protein [Gammaproteobacteria bacterium TMED134]
MHVSPLPFCINQCDIGSRLNRT